MRKLIAGGWYTVTGELHFENADPHRTGMEMFQGTVSINLEQLVTPRTGSDELQGDQLYELQGDELNEFFANLQRTLDNTANNPEAFNFDGSFCIRDGFGREKLFDLKLRHEFVEFVAFCHKTAKDAKAENTIAPQTAVTAKQLHRSSLQRFIASREPMRKNVSEPLNNLRFANNADFTVSTKSLPTNARMILLNANCDFATHKYTGQVPADPYDPNNSSVAYREQSRVQFQFYTGIGNKFFSDLQNVCDVLNSWLNIPTVKDENATVTVIPDLRQRQITMVYDVPPDDEERMVFWELTENNVRGLAREIITFVQKNIDNRPTSIADMTRNELFTPLLTSKTLTKLTNDRPEDAARNSKDNRDRTTKDLPKSWLQMAFSCC